MVEIEIILPEKLLYNFNINWNLHRASSSDGNKNSITKKLEYNVDDDDNVIIQTPDWKYTMGAISLFLPISNPHAFTQSIFSTQMGGKCWVTNQNNNKLPDGLGLVYDGPVKLKFWRKASTEEKKIMKYEHHHFSLVCCKRMSETDFLKKINEFFSDDYFNVCNMKAEAIIELQSINIENFDSTMKHIILCLEIIINDKELKNINFILDLVALHTFIDNEKPLTFDVFLINPLYSRIAYHALSLYDSMCASLSIKFNTIAAEIETKYGWDDYCYNEYKIIESGLDNNIENINKKSLKQIRTHGDKEKISTSFEKVSNLYPISHNNNASTDKRCFRAY